MLPSHLSLIIFATNNSSSGQVVRRITRNDKIGGSIPLWSSSLENPGDLFAHFFAGPAALRTLAQIQSFAT
jgi:hypothetical protein